MANVIPGSGAPGSGVLAPTPVPTPAPNQPLAHVTFDDTTGPSVPMYNYDSKSIVQVPRDEVEVRLRSKRYVLPKGVQVPLINPENPDEGGHFSDEKLTQALDKGWTIEPQELTHKRVIDEKFGGRPFSAAAASFADSASLGIIPQVLTRTGTVKKETFSGLEEANPIPSGVGQVAGIAAGMFGPSELALPMKAAEMAGKGAEKAAAKWLGKEALAAGASEAVKKSIVEKMVPTLAGSVVEGAFYGGGNLLSENALGRADINAENLMGAVGVGALIGGGIGALGAGLEAASPYLAKGAKAANGALEEGMNSLTDKTKAVQNLFELTPKEALKAERMSLSEKMPVYVKENLGLTAGSSDKEMLHALQGDMDRSGSVIGKTIETLETAGQSHLIAPEAAKVYDKIEAAVRPFLEKVEGTEAGKAAEKQIKKILEGYEENYAKKDFLNAKDMFKEKVATDFDVRDSYGKDVTTQTIAAKKAIRNVFNEEISAMADKAAQIPGIDANIAATLKKANSDFQIASTLEPALERKLSKKGGLSFGDKAALVFSAFHGPGAMIMAGIGKFLSSDVKHRLVILTNLEKANMAMQKAVQTGIKGFFKGTSVVAETGVRAAQFHFSQSPFASDLDTGKKPKTDAEAWKNINDNLHKYASDPQNLVDRMAKNMHPMHETAPDTTGALTATAANAVQFLQSKLPKAASQQGVLNMLQGPPKPSQFDTGKFEKYLRAVEEPKSVLKDFEKGTINREGVETLKSVYPNTFEALQKSVMDEISRNSILSYNKKLKLGILLDMPTDTSLIGENVLALQSSFAGQAAPQPQSSAVKPSAKGMDKLDVADRALMPQQKVASREEI